MANKRILRSYKNACHIDQSNVYPRKSYPPFNPAQLRSFNLPFCNYHYLCSPATLNFNSEHNGFYFFGEHVLVPLRFTDIRGLRQIIWSPAQLLELLRSGPSRRHENATVQHETSSEIMLNSNAPCKGNFILYFMHVSE